MALERELEFFKKNKAEWLKYYKGQFAVVKNEQLLGTFTTFEEAFHAGVKALGNQPFLIRKIGEQEEIAQFPALEAGVLSADL